MLLSQEKRESGTKDVQSITETFTADSSDQEQHRKTPSASMSRAQNRKTFTLAPSLKFNTPRRKKTPHSILKHTEMEGG